jgi:6-pyruvoyltetrahydropterin/6-carboxytetrahydropterin synthase
MYEVWIKTSFSAAHRLRGYSGKCESLHGHNWVVEVSITCKNLNKMGLTIDFSEVKTKLFEIIEKLDHKDLNDPLLVPFFKERNPSAENIAYYIYQELKDKISSPGIKLSKVMIKESENSGVSYHEK